MSVADVYLQSFAKGGHYIMLRVLSINHSVQTTIIFSLKLNHLNHLNLNHLNLNHLNLTLNLPLNVPLEDDTLLDGTEWDNNNN